MREAVQATGGGFGRRPGFQARVQAHLQALFADHGILRLWWTNRAAIAPGVWRMNQPGHARLRRLRDEGVRTIVNLRGPARQPYRLLQDESCRVLGLTQHCVRMRARAAPSRGDLLALIDLLERVEPPLAMHCKSGADRTGMAAALWRILREGDDAATAMRQLTAAHGHSARSRAGVQGQVLRAFAAEGEARGLTLRVWAETRYQPEAVTRDFLAWRRGQRGWAGLRRLLISGT